MSLPDALLLYAQIIADQIINECELDPPIDEAKFRLVRYHGHAIPEDVQCTPDGTLSAWWENITPKPGTECPFPVAALNAKYVTCWKQADVTGKPPTMKVFYDQNDADADRLAWIAECVTRRLLTLVCAKTFDPDGMPLDHEFMQMANKPVFLGATPTGAQGGAAGITWRMQIGLLDRVPTS